MLSTTKLQLAFYPEGPELSPKKIFDEMLSKAIHAPDFALGLITRLFDQVALSSYNGFDAEVLKTLKELLDTDSQLYKDVLDAFQIFTASLTGSGEPDVQFPDSLKKKFSIFWAKFYNDFFQSPPYFVSDEIRDFIGSDKLDALHRRWGITEINQLLFSGFYNHFWQEVIVKFGDDVTQKNAELPEGFNVYLYTLIPQLPKEIHRNNYIHDTNVETSVEFAVESLSAHCVDELTDLIELIVSAKNLSANSKVLKNYIHDLAKIFMAKLFLLDGSLNPKYADLISEDIRKALPKDYQFSLLTELMRRHITDAMSKLPQYKDRLEYFTAQLLPSVLKPSYIDIQQQFEIHNIPLRDPIIKELQRLTSLYNPCHENNVFQQCLAITAESDNKTAGNQIRRVLETLKEYIATASNDRSANLLILREAEDLVAKIEEELTTRRELYQLDRLCSHSSLCISSSQNISSQEAKFFHDLSQIRQDIDEQLNSSGKREFFSESKTFAPIYQEFHTKIDPLLTKNAKRRRGENTELDENIQNRKSWFSGILSWNKIANMAKRIALRVWTSNPEVAPAASAAKTLEFSKPGKRRREEDTMILRIGISR